MTLAPIFFLGIFLISYLTINLGFLYFHYKAAVGWPLLVLLFPITSLIGLVLFEDNPSNSRLLTWG
jgi:UPF0716 family protein affecting phage T7 exclusion